MTIRYPDFESERNQNLRTSNLELRQLWEAEKARADGYALLVGEYRAALERAGTDLIGFEGYFERIGSMGTVASIRVTLHMIDAILAAEPEARAADLAAATARAEKAEAEVRRLRAIGQVEYDGAMAFLTGIPLESNPHREHGEDWHLWRRGYQRVSDRERVRDAEARAADLLQEPHKNSASVVE